MFDIAKRLISEEEGRNRYAYFDSRKLLTIGIGALVDPSIPGSGLCDAAIDAQFSHDSERARADAESLPGFQRCNEVQRAVLVSMCFQLGNLHDWPHFKAALSIGDYAAAQIAGLDSDWARTQAPKRAKRQMQMLATGQWVDRT